MVETEVTYRGTELIIFKFTVHMCISNAMFLFLFLGLLNLILLNLMYLIALHECVYVY